MDDGVDEGEAQGCRGTAALEATRCLRDCLALPEVLSVSDSSHDSASITCSDWAKRDCAELARLDEEGRGGGLLLRDCVGGGRRASGTGTPRKVQRRRAAAHAKQRPRGYTDAGAARASPVNPSSRWNHLPQPARAQPMAGRR